MCIQMTLKFTEVFRSIIVRWVKNDNMRWLTKWSNENCRWEIYYAQFITNKLRPYTLNMCFMGLKNKQADLE